MRCKRIKDGKLTSPVDHGGHLIGRQFGGPGEQINYVPMFETLNTSGEWYEMEMSWANKIENGIIITDIAIHITYGSTKKPTGFVVSWKENGVLNPDTQNKPLRINNN